MACTKAPADYAKKKSPLYKERDEVKRQSFLLNLSQHAINKCVYIDESGIDKFISREHGWGERGQRVIGEISGRRYARESFIAGLVSNQVVAPLCYTGTCDTILFNFWLENFLLPELGPGYTIIMDNAAFHKSEETKRLIGNAHCHLLFLPPYSPDFNPIEKFWANLKNKIKKIIANFNSLAEAVDYAFRSII
ncbi:MAG: IS630 family transposase [Gammaproteobacteria bacterium]|nr:IS630 family transposase [Gammaproteobacteria bacterium]